MKVDWRITIAAIAAITLLESIALFKGVDGVLLSSALIIIAGIGGYKLRYGKR